MVGHLMILKHMVEFVILGKYNKKIKKQEFAHGDDNAFMLNDCKYLYNMYRRYSMLSLV